MGCGPQFELGQIGFGTLKSTELPVNSNWGYNYSQQIYKASKYWQL